MLVAFQAFLATLALGGQLQRRLVFELLVHQKSAKRGTDFPESGNAFAAVFYGMPVMSIKGSMTVDCLRYLRHDDLAMSLPLQALHPLLPGSSSQAGL